MKNYVFKETNSLMIFKNILIYYLIKGIITLRNGQNIPVFMGFSFKGNIKDFSILNQ